MKGGGKGWPYLARRLGSSRFSGGFASECWTIASREKLQMFHRRTDVPQADRCSTGGQDGGGGGGRGCSWSPGSAAWRRLLLAGTPLLCTGCGSLPLPEFLHISPQSADNQHFLWLPKSRDEAQASQIPPSFPFLDESPQTLIGPVRLNGSKSIRAWDHLQTCSFMYQEWSPLQAGSGGFCSFGFIGHLKLKLFQLLLVPWGISVIGPLQDELGNIVPIRCPLKGEAWKLPSSWENISVEAVRTPSSATSGGIFSISATLA